MVTREDLIKYTFTEGAHITPIFWEGKWVWVVREFDGDTYCDGKNISPEESSEKFEGLIHPDDWNSDE